MFRSSLLLLFLLLIPTLSFAEDMIIKLPKPVEKGTVSLEETIKKRRSKRNFSGKDLTLDEISQLLWSCQGITEQKRGYRSAPSAGATYPLEIYLVNKEGLFHYIPRTHSMERLDEKDLRGELRDACFGQGFVKDAAINIVISADFKRTSGRYRKKGENFVYIEVGHAAENVHLQAVALGLGSVSVGAFSDDAIKKLLHLPEELVPVYVIPIGYIKE